LYYSPDFFILERLQSMRCSRLSPFADLVFLQLPGLVEEHRNPIAAKMDTWHAILTRDRNVNNFVQPLVTSTPRPSRQLLLVFRDTASDVVQHPQEEWPENRQNLVRGI
jgi:hypothetical protein